jgi:hypothetical protein
VITKACTILMAFIAAAYGNAVAAHARTAAVPRCYTRSLTAWLHGSQVGLGNRGFILTLANAGSTSCSLYGYPGLGLENARHQTLRSHTSWGGTYFDPGVAPTLIVLSPGETASADVAFAADGESADSVTATYLQVTPPNAYLHLTVRIPGAPVAIYGGNLFVTALARRTPY